MSRLRILIILLDHARHDLWWTLRHPRDAWTMAQTEHWLERNMRHVIWYWKDTDDAGK
jgi:hypothetical protein